MMEFFSMYPMQDILPVFYYYIKGPFTLGDDDDDLYSKGPFAVDGDDKLELTMSSSEKLQHPFMTMSSSN